MSRMQPIDDARSVLEDASLMATQTVKAFYAAFDDAQEVPPWLFVLARQIDAWDTATRDYVMQVHMHARPVLGASDALADAGRSGAVLD